MSAKTHRNEISREEAAGEVLSIWEEAQHSLRSAMSLLTDEWKIGDWRIRTAIHSLVFETVRRLNTIDFVLNSVLAKTELQDLDPLVRNALRVATYLIIYDKGVPALATNEAVSIVKRRRNKRLAGFTNAVLRNVQKIDLEPMIKTAIKQGHPEIEYSVPQWLYEHLQQQLGPEESKAFFAATLINPSVYIRINTLHKKADQVIKNLEREQFQCTPIPQLPEIFKLQRGTKPVTQTQVYDQNTIYIQSLASALVARVLNPDKRDIVVDLCAAPGSKTSHLAQLMENQGNIIAVDNGSERISKLVRSLNRLGVRNSHIILANSFKLPFRKDFYADCVLIDPPCSNTGVIQTRPEVKWRLTPERIRRLQKVQSGLLRAGSQIVAPSGFALYSTCAITVEENEKIILDFLANNGDFELVPTHPQIGTDAFENLKNCQRLFPHKHDTEGFFIAKLHRKPPDKI